MSELLPCPWCGIAPLACDPANYEGWYGVYCPSDFCAASPSTEAKSEVEAIRLWNTRAQPALKDETEKHEYHCAQESDGSAGPCDCKLSIRSAALEEAALCAESFHEGVVADYIRKLKNAP